MSITLISPLNDAAVARGIPAPRLATLAGKRIALLDISKPGGSIFLDRLSHLLTERYGVAEILRSKKATYTKPAQAQVLEALRGVDAVVEALAD